MILSNVNLWSAIDETVNKCESAFSMGSCLHSGDAVSYAITTTSIMEPAGYTMPTLSGDLSAGFATDPSIPIPTIPSTFYPGLPAVRPLAKDS